MKVTLIITRVADWLPLADLPVTKIHPRITRLKKRKRFRYFLLMKAHKEHSRVFTRVDNDLYPKNWRSSGRRWLNKIIGVNKLVDNWETCSGRWWACRSYIQAHLSKLKNITKYADFSLTETKNCQKVSSWICDKRHLPTIKKTTCYTWMRTYRDQKLSKGNQLNLW